MSVGGRIIEIQPMHTDSGKPVIRLWVVDRHDTETCVYAEPFERRDGPFLGDEVWWQSGRIYFDQDRRWLTKVGYSFAARHTGER